jgi:hypothetical protein
MKMVHVEAHGLAAAAAMHLAVAQVEVSAAQPESNPHDMTSVMGRPTMTIS